MNFNIEKQICELKDHLVNIEKSKLILEENILFQRQDIRKYKEKIKVLKKNIEKLNTENIILKSENFILKKVISELESKYDMLIKELKIQNNINKKYLFLKEVAFQTEKNLVKCKNMKREKLHFTFFFS